MTNNKAGNIIREVVKSFGPTPFTFDELYAKLKEKAEKRNLKREPEYLNKMIIARVTLRMIVRQQVKFKQIGEDKWGYVLTEYLPEGESKSSFERPPHVKVVNTKQQRTPRPNRSYGDSRPTEESCI